MANWTSITVDDLKAAGHGAIIDRAQTVAVGGVDPVAEAIAESVARVRRAVARKNAVDADVAKVPNSLKALTVRMALYTLMRRIRMPLSDDDKAQRTDDGKDIEGIAAKAGLVETPDNPVETSPVPRNLGTWNSERKILGRMHPVPPPARQYPAQPNAYANPDAPEDSTE